MKIKSKNIKPYLIKIIFHIFVFAVLLGYYKFVYLPKHSLERSQIQMNLQVQKNEIDSLKKENACRKADELLGQIKETCGSMPFPGIDECIKGRTEGWDANFSGKNLDMANKMKELKPQYLSLKAQCEE